MLQFRRATLVFTALTIGALAVAAEPTGTSPTSTTTPTPTTPSTTPTSSTPTTSTGTTKPAENLSDAQIASLVVAINQAEIDSGKYMVGKATNADVKKFAQQMVDDHTAMLTKVQDWQKRMKQQTATSQTQTDMQNGAKTEMTDLGKLSGNDLDRKYVDTAVTDHQKVLDMLDHQLIDQADDADLKAALRDARTKVAAHLDSAKRLQTTLGTHPAQNGNPSSTTSTAANGH